MKRVSEGILGMICYEIISHGGSRNTPSGVDNLHTTKMRLLLVLLGATLPWNPYTATLISKSIRYSMVSCRISGPCWLLLLHMIYYFNTGNNNNNNNGIDDGKGHNAANNNNNIFRCSKRIFNFIIKLAQLFILYISKYGKYTYSAYISHHIIYGIFGATIIPKLTLASNGILQPFLFVPIVILVVVPTISYTMYHYIESKINRHVKSFIVNKLL